MDTWISRPADGDVREWHLVEGYQPTVPAARILVAACSATLILSDGIETAMTDEIDEAQRCPTCQRIYLGRIEG